MPVKKGREGVRAEMEKFKAGTLHSGSKNGPKVTDPKQAIAIALHTSGMSKYGSNPHQEKGSGDTPAVSDGGGRFQMYDYWEQQDQFEEGPDEFQCDTGDHPEFEHPGVKVKQRARRQVF